MLSFIFTSFQKAVTFFPKQLLQNVGKSWQERVSCSAKCFSSKFFFCFVFVLFSIFLACVSKAFRSCRCVSKQPTAKQPITDVEVDAVQKAGGTRAWPCDLLVPSLSRRPLGWRPCLAMCPLRGSWGEPCGAGSWATSRGTCAGGQLCFGEKCHLWKLHVYCCGNFALDKWTSCWQRCWSVGFWLAFLSVFHNCFKLQQTAMLYVSGCIGVPHPAEFSHSRPVRGWGCHFLWLFRSSGTRHGYQHCSDQGNFPLGRCVKKLWKMGEYAGFVFAQLCWEYPTSESAKRREKKKKIRGKVMKWDKMWPSNSKQQ